MQDIMCQAQPDPTLGNTDVFYVREIMKQLDGMSQKSGFEPGSTAQQLYSLQQVVQLLCPVSTSEKRGQQQNLLHSVIVRSNEHSAKSSAWHVVSALRGLAITLRIVILRLLFVLRIYYHSDNGVGNWLDECQTEAERPVKNLLQLSR